jgi:uncharacterized membrane protein YdjX (TVP38/TMEM64 family)
VKPSTQPWRSVWFWVAVAVVVALAAFMLFSSTFKEWIEAVAAWAEGIMRSHPVPGAVVFFVLSAISALIAFASSVLLVPPANEVWGKPVTFLLLWGGWTAGAIAAFFIGYYGRSLLFHLVSRQEIEKYETLVSRRMTLWAATLLCLAVPSELPGYLLGALHYPFWKFLIAIAIAEGVYAIGVVVAGESLMEAKPAMLVLTGLALVAVAVGAGYLLRTRRTRAK